MLDRLMMRIRCVGWRCAFGLHEDSFIARSGLVFYTTEKRCKWCGEPTSRHEQRLLRQERALWASVPKDMSADDQNRWVLGRLPVSERERVSL